VTVQPVSPIGKSKNHPGKSAGEHFTFAAFVWFWWSMARVGCVQPMSAAVGSRCADYVTIETFIFANP
jgi:hypothetical protein